MATGYQGSFGPESSSDPVASFLHWAWYGRAPGAGLGAVPGQLASSLDPRSRAGLINLASMFVPGARGGGYGAEPLPEDVLSEWQPAAHFKNYDHQTGGPLDRGIALEGPGAGNSGAGIRGLLRRAQGVNPLRKNDPVAVAQAKHDILAKQMAQNIARHRAMQAVKMRSQVNEHLGAAPMAGHVEHPAPEHDYFASHELDHTLEHNPNPHIDARLTLLHNLLQRQYQAGSAHHN